MGKASKEELDPIPWDKIRPHYKAGVLSLRAIAKQFGCSPAAILKHAAKHEWGPRDLKPAIHARADQLVNTQAVNTSVNRVTDAETVEVNAQALAIVRLGHRRDAAKLRELVGVLMRKAEAVIGDPEIFGRAWDVLLSTDEDVDLQVLRDMADLVASLPAQTKVLKDLAEAMHRVIGMEREAYGLNTEAGTDGAPLVIIKDFTGRGDPDSPFSSLKSNGGA